MNGGFLHRFKRIEGAVLPTPSVDYVRHRGCRRVDASQSTRTNNVRSKLL